MPDIKATLTTPLGPLPRYAWVLVIVGGYFGYKFLSGRSGSSSTAAATPTGASGIPVDQSGYQQTIQDLINRIPVPPAPPTTPEPPPPTVEPIQTITETGTLMQDSAIRLISTANGALVVPTQGSYILGRPIDIPGYSGPNQLSHAHIVTQDGQTFYVLDRNLASIIPNAAASASAVGSNMVQSLSSPVATPQFGNNTATPTPTSNAVNVASGSLADAVQETIAAPSMPTYSNEYVASSSLKIPATTPA